MKQKLQILICFWVLIALPTASHAQQNVIDSLQKVLHKKLNDTNRVKTLVQLAAQHMNMLDKKTKEYAEKALTLAQKIDFPRSEADALFILGIYAYNFDEPKEGLLFYRKSLKIAEKANYHSCVERCEQFFGNYYYHNGNYTKALIHYHKALEIAEKYQYNYSVATIANNMGLVYQNEKDLDKALYFLEKSAKYAKKENDNALLAGVLGDMSGIYTEQKAYQRALEYAQHGFSIAQKTLDSNLIYDTQNEVAKAYAGLGQAQKGVDLLQESLAYFQKNGNIFNEVYSQIELSRIYTQTKQFDKAQKVLDNALKATQKEKPQDQIRAIYEEYTTLYKAKGDYKLAFEYLERHNVLKDSIFGIQKVREITEIEYFYEKDQKEKALALQKQQNNTLKAENKAKNLWIAVLGLGVFLIGLVAVLVVRNRQHRLRLAKQALKNTQENIHSIEQELYKAQQDMAGNQAQIKQFQKMLDDKRAEVLKEIKAEKYINKYEGGLEEYINLLLPDFITAQNERYPDLSKEHLYLLFFREIHLSNKEIATKFGISETGVRTRWSRFNSKYHIDNQ